jgi:acyl carrier protein phosphodiesterase
VNYLAHAYLSGDNEELLVGNFIADHLRGNNFKNYSEGVVEGIRLHRKIDTFTDSHPLFKASKRLFYKGFEKYSGILVDIYFDHLLAKNFKQFHSKSLGDFSTEVYKVYAKNESLMPEMSVRFLNYVLKNNVYQTYADLKGIETVLSHLSHRIGHGIALNTSLAQFVEAEGELEENFFTFIPDLRANLQGSLSPKI